MVGECGGGGGCIVCSIRMLREVDFLPPFFPSSSFSYGVWV